MVVKLSSETSQVAERLARKAGFKDASAFLNDVIEQLRLKAALEEAFDDEEAGRIKDVDDVFNGLFKKHKLPRKRSK